MGSGLLAGFILINKIWERELKGIQLVVFWFHILNTTGCILVPHSFFLFQKKNWKKHIRKKNLFLKEKTKKKSRSRVSARKRSRSIKSAKGGPQKEHRKSSTHSSSSCPCPMRCCSVLWGKSHGLAFLVVNLVVNLDDIEILCKQMHTVISLFFTNYKYEMLLTYVTFLGHSTRSLGSGPSADASPRVQVLAKRSSRKHLISSRKSVRSSKVGGAQNNQPYIEQCSSVDGTRSFESCLQHWSHSCFGPHDYLLDDL